LGSYVELNFDAGVFLSGTATDTADAFCSASVVFTPAFFASAVLPTEDAQAYVQAASYIQYLCQAGIALDDCAAEAVALYDINVWRGITSSIGIPSEDGTRALGETLSGWRANSSANAIAPVPWGGISRIKSEQAVGWRLIPQRTVERGSDWGVFRVHMDTGLGFGWKAPPPAPIESLLPWGLSGLKELSLGVFYKAPPKVRRFFDASFQQGTHRERALAVPCRQGTHRHRNPYALPWGDADFVWTEGGPALPPAPPPPPKPPKTNADLVFTCRMPDWSRYMAKNNGLLLSFLASGCPFYTPHLEIRRGSISMLNTIEVIRVSDNTHIPATAVTLSTDSSFWCWDMPDLTLEGESSLELITSSDGSPVEIMVIINGYQWRIIVESYSQSQDFGKVSWQATGRSPSAYLSSPYARVRSYSEQGSSSAANLMDYELAYSGWEMEYHPSLLQLMTTDWILSPGCYSYQDKTPMEALLMFPAAIGGFLSTHRFQNKLVMSPGYTVDPREWASYSSDFDITRSLIQSYQERLSPKPDYNYAVVSGSRSGGVVVQATLNGSAGATPAPQVVEPMITAVQAGLERARTVLFNCGRQSEVSLTLPLTVDTGLLVPGLVGSVSTGTQAWMGMVSKVSISANLASVSQHVDIVRHFL
jgi:hypothetical protein